MNSCFDNFLQFEEGATPSAYAFALVEHRGGRETLMLRMFLSGEIKQIDKLDVESSPRLLKMLPVLKTKETFLWILKVSSISVIKIMLSLHLYHSFKLTHMCGKLHFYY